MAVVKTMYHLYTWIEIQASFSLTMHTTLEQKQIADIIIANVTNSCLDLSPSQVNNLQEEKITGWMLSIPSCSL